VLVPEVPATSVGSGIFAQLAAGIFKTVEEAQDRMCPTYKIYEPEPKAAAIYEELYQLYRKVYFAFGDRKATPQPLTEVLHDLREIASRVHGDAAKA
jgi:L-ribulokinase